MVTKKEKEGKVKGTKASFWIDHAYSHNKKIVLYYFWDIIQFRVMYRQRDGSKFVESKNFLSKLVNDRNSLHVSYSN